MVLFLGQSLHEGTRFQLCIAILSIARNIQCAEHQPDELMHVYININRYGEVLRKHELVAVLSLPIKSHSSFTAR